MSLHTYKSYIHTLLDNPIEEKAFFDAIDRPLDKSLHLLQSRISTTQFIEKNPTRTLTPTTHKVLKNIYYVDRSDRNTPLGSTRRHQAGYYYIQEVAASIPAHFVDIPPHALVLDMCAAPGGKSIQLADRMAREQPDTIGCIRSNDIDSKRLTVLATNLNRSGLAHTATSKINGASFGVVFPETFDSILLDAPCSGEGTGYKSASAYEWWSEKSIHDITNIQQALLHSAAKACKIGGSIIYSTCTLNHRENESQIARLLDTYPDVFEIENIHIPTTKQAITHYQNSEIISTQVANKCIRCRPHHQHTGGFFVTKIRKKASIAKPYTFDKAKTKQTQFSTSLNYSRQENKTIKKRLHKSFGIDVDLDQYAIVTSTKTAFLTSRAIVPFLDHARFEKVGIPIAKILTNKRTNQKECIPLQHLANTLGYLATHHIIDITPDQAQTYTEGAPLDVSDHNLEDRTYYLIHVNGLPFSLGKVIDGKMKNKFIGV